MTTITIKDGKKKFSKTSFKDAQELFVYLRNELKPLSVFLIDEDSLSPKSLTTIEKSKNNPNRKLTNFQG